MNSFSQSRSDRSSVALFIVATFQAVAGGLHLCFYGGRADFRWEEWIFVWSFPAFIVLGLFARRFTSFPMLIAFALQMYFFVYLSFLPGHGSFVWDGRIFTVLAIAVIGMALFMRINRELVEKSASPVNFDVWTVVRIAVYSISIFGSTLTLVYVNQRLVNLGKLAEMSVSISGTTAHEMNEDLVGQTRFALWLYLMAAGILAFCALGCLREFARASARAKGFGKLDKAVGI